ncbi:MAG TPA: argininosuccinate lyase [Phycisphaerae bacterium]|nr:argininosuccinate lyase [Phycisphaerae bacterium]HUT57776.1 argininosuccinate lyase [Phycisphaerae bacterium]
MAPGKKKATARKSWSSRLGAEPDAATAELLASLDVDVALWRYDIAGSVAHARMLSEVGLISRAEHARIKKGLLRIAKDLEAGRLELPAELEDIHMVIEAALVRRVGQAGLKLHTGRSRNDQVALDLRLWARDAIDNLTDGIVRLQRVFVKLAEKHGLVVVPAYTHLQRAQPVLAGHAMLAYVEMLQRDAERLADARTRVNVCPLGAGAVAGTSLPIDRARTAELLGFDRIARNSIDATADRDFLAELLFACAMLGVHLSRWAEDWIIYATTEFAMIELADAVCTSSSMMPQKKNPDALELIRAKSATAIGSLAGMLALLKGLPLAYNRDLQDDKRLVFPAVEAMRLSLDVAAEIVTTARLRAKAVAERIDEGYLDATSLAEYLVVKGVPFRRAHQIVGRLVAKAAKTGLALGKLPLATLRAACEAVGPDVKAHLGAANVVKRYCSEGAGGPKQLRRQLTFWRKALGK